MKKKFIQSLRWIFLIFAGYQAIHLVVGLSKLVIYLNEFGVGPGVGTILALATLKTVVGLVAWGISIWLKKLLVKLDSNPRLGSEDALAQKGLDFEQKFVEPLSIPEAPSEEREQSGKVIKEESPSERDLAMEIAVKNKDKFENKLFIGWVLLVVCLFLVILFNWSAPDTELSWNKGLETWEHHKKYPPIQISESNYGGGIYGLSTTTRGLRRIYKDESRQVRVWYDDQSQLNAEFMFHEKCKYLSVIETSYRYSNDEPVELTCDLLLPDDAESSYLFLSLVWTQKPSNFKFSFSGFEVNEDFTTWDFSALDRDLSVLERRTAANNAQIPDQVLSAVPSEDALNACSVLRRIAKQILEGRDKGMPKDDYLASITEFELTNEITLQDHSVISMIRPVIENAWEWAGDPEEFLSTVYGVCLKIQIGRETSDD